MTPAERCHQYQKAWRVRARNQALTDCARVLAWRTQARVIRRGECRYTFHATAVFEGRMIFGELA